MLLLQSVFRCTNSRRRHFLFGVLAAAASSTTSTTRGGFGWGIPSTAAAMSTSASSPAAPSDSKVGALIFLHGLGDTPAGWSFLQYELPQMKPHHLTKQQIVYVFPPAPTIALTINGGMRMPGWFDLFDWPIGVGSTDDPVSKLQAIQQIEAEITKVQEQYGIPREKVVVGGFSQGGAIALLNAYHTSTQSKGRLAGCVGLSAWLTLVDDIQVPPPPVPTDNSDDEQTTTSTPTQTPLFWGHGTYDDKVLFGQQAFGIQKLKEKGLSPELIQATNHPMGHESCPDEMEAFANFLVSCFYPKSKKNDNDKKKKNKKGASKDEL